MKKLFITDLDGTALGGGYEPYARFPDFFSEFIDTLAGNGFHWGINTTWDVGGQWDLVKVSSLKSRPDFMMAEFGLRLASPAFDLPEYIQPYTDRMEQRLKEFQYSKFQTLLRELCGNFACARVMYYGHLLCFELAENEDSDAFEAFAEQLSLDTEFISKLSGRQLSARPAFMNKGEPLREILKLKQLIPEQVIVAGDEVTDLGMMALEIAKHYICPANAAKEVKEHVLMHGGVVGSLEFGAGVVQAFKELAKRNNWSIGI
jgi:hypothetical protein